MGITIAPPISQDVLAEASMASSLEQGVFDTLPAHPSRLTKFGISLDQLKFNEIVIDFKSPIEFGLFLEDDLWNCQNEELSLLAFGTTVEEAVRSFSEDFLAVFDVIALSPDEELTVEAQRVKDVMLKLVASVARR